MTLLHLADDESRAVRFRQCFGLIGGFFRLFLHFRPIAQPRILVRAT